MSETSRALILPDLPSSIRFVLLPKTQATSDHAFQIKRAALGRHITARWGWDETLQRISHDQVFRERPLLSVIHDEKSVGVISLASLPECVELNDFYLMPPYQGRGLGTTILRHCLSVVDGLGLPMRLQHLKRNPVGVLYRRHDFEVAGETKDHWLMHRQAMTARRSSTLFSMASL